MPSDIPVCIFAKPPQSAKTRLIPALGAASAAQLASAMLLDTWSMVASCPGVRPILATTQPGDFPISVPASDIWLQGDGDLGRRIHCILTRALIHASVVIAVGADSPALSCAHLQMALACVRTSDAVIGPSTDGGFYLLSLRRCPPGLFDSIPWSTAATRRALTERLREHAFTIAELEPLFDVDTAADLRLLERHLSCHPSPGAATKAWYSENRARLIAALPCE
jgi:hypothetical protein